MVFPRSGSVLIGNKSLGIHGLSWRTSEEKQTVLLSYLMSLHATLEPEHHGSQLPIAKKKHLLQISVSSQQQWDGDFFTWLISCIFTTVLEEISTTLPTIQISQETNTNWDLDIIARQILTHLCLNYCKLTKKIDILSHQWKWNLSRRSQRFTAVLRGFVWERHFHRLITSSYRDTEG